MQLTNHLKPRPCRHALKRHLDRENGAASREFESVNAYYTVICLDWDRIAFGILFRKRMTVIYNVPLILARSRDDAVVTCSGGNAGI